MTQKSVVDDWLEAAARAKVNLRLRIFPRGPDGFHPIDTVFCRIDLADRVRLRIRSAPGVSIHVSGPEWAPQGPENLAARAALLYQQEIGGGFGVEIELEKRVPPGSGLGGGSSDAATVLRLLAAHSAASVPTARLLALASRLGADVGFFTADVPLARGRGRGDRLDRCAPLDPRPMLVALPPFQVSTAEAYELWDTEQAARSALTEEEHWQGEPTVAGWKNPEDWADVAATAENSFEDVILRRYAGLRALRDEFQATEPVLSLLSGSGSAIFAVYDNEGSRDRAAEHLRAERSDVRFLSVYGPV